MLLNKKVGVFLNLVHCRFKLYLSVMFQKHGYDITPEQFLVLDALWDFGVQSQQEIAEKIMKDKNSVTKLIDGLEKKNYLIRESYQRDRRQNQIRLTRQGNEIKDGVTKVAIKATDQIIRDITKEEMDIFLRVIYKMMDNMKLENENMPEFSV
ncbi:MAG: MarR family transcriptional regulator [Bacteroidales bacterium]|nr:MarR family transcriptional regulator [Bacteroidales bacterium]MDD2424476.1 MarR family transcriptional regulator [Bacteroidales bacterium]MDD3988542.1 MarR family transcriptional regulator [Bacteroidales bacterium]MDD4638747.1 MarR family transcriptional regulator [Bacteroidales bacterium]